MSTGNVVMVAFVAAAAVGVATQTSCGDRDGASAPTPQSLAASAPGTAAAAPTPKAVVNATPSPPASVPGTRGDGRDPIVQPAPTPTVQPGGTGDGSSGLDDPNVYGGRLGHEGEIGGGFGYGRSAFGPNGEVTGWRTSGTGRYGTIGHGSGRGVAGGHVPRVTAGQPNAQGDLDKVIIRRYVKRSLQKVQDCYEQQLVAKPGLAGTISAQFFITPDGSVASSVATGVDPEVASCVAGVIRDIEFPKPKDGGAVHVNFPFTFRQG
jgi:hypothetical protein